MRFFLALIFLNLDTLASYAIIITSTVLNVVDKEQIFNFVILI